MSIQFRNSSTTLLLASSSPRRQELIRSLGLPFAIQVSDVDETVPADWEPLRIVEALSLRKAEAVRNQLREPSPDTVVIGSDTIVVLAGQVLGKPRDEKDAKRMLSELQGRTHQVFSGVACLSAAAGGWRNAEEQTGGGYTDLGPVKYRLLENGAVGHSMTNVTFKPLTLQQIERYVATGEPMDKAGAYGAQGLGATLVSRLDGDYFGVVGLPMFLLAEMLKTFGIQVP